MVDFFKIVVFCPRFGSVRLKLVPSGQVVLFGRSVGRWSLNRSVANRSRSVALIGRSPVLILLIFLILLILLK